MMPPANVAEHTFEQLFRQWNRKVYHFALSKTNSTYIADETVQRVFIKLWHNLQTKDLDIPAEVQLFTISRSVLLDVLKEENRRYAVLHQFPEQATAQQDLTQIEYKDLLQEVEKLIAQMPPMRQQVFRLSRFEQLNYAEIAKLLAISKRTVENHIALALKTIRKSFSHLLWLFLLFFNSH